MAMLLLAIQLYASLILYCRWWFFVNVEHALSRLPSYSEELGLDLSKPADRFKWFLASILFAKRISAEIAKKTYLHFEQEDLVSPDAILAAGWDRLVKVLGAGGYARYDSSTANALLGISKTLKEKYGDLERLYAQSVSSEDLENRLLEFKGVGPVGVNIFLRELRGVWEKAKPKPSPMAIATAQKIGLNLKDVESCESQLVRLNLEYCKKRRSFECPLKESCPDRKHLMTTLLSE